MIKYLVVGAGFSGAVMARQLVEKGDCTVIVLDERNHIGGNCHTERDPSTGVMVHRYGPHIFNTTEKRVWDYVNSFGVFRPFINRVKASTSKGVFALPVNLHTINQLFGTRLSPAEARAFLAEKGDSSIGEPQNFEEQALKMLGRELYETLFYGYTKKQWGCEPRELPAAFLKRLPVRFTYDDNYYDKTYQGIPEEGYTEIIRRILDHPRIDVRLGERFDPCCLAPGPGVSPLRASASQQATRPVPTGTAMVLPPSLPLMSPQGLRAAQATRPVPTGTCSHIFYTGPIDAFFGYSLGRLSYRTVTFERIDADGDFQGNAVINYPDEAVPYTRIHEHKHFTPWETHEKTVAFREFSQETGPSDTPYYPKRQAADLALLQKYRDLAESFSEHPTSNIQHQTSKTSFLGRLATYRYMDMERVIAEALDFAEAFRCATVSGRRPPVFPNAEES